MNKLAIYTNPLETEEEIQAYKDWLDTKSNAFLRHILVIFNLPEGYRNNYPNLELRKTLVSEVISKRLN